MARVAAASKTKTEIICVRLKRYNPKKGHVMRRFLIWGQKFDEERNWYKIQSKVTFAGEVHNIKEYLENVHQDNEDPESPLAFDVVTPKEAERIMKHEEEQARRASYNLRTGNTVDLTHRRGGSERGDLSTNDVTGKPSRRKFPRSTKRAASKDSISADE